MTHDTAMLVSSALAAEGIAHTLSVGYHENHNPPVQCHVAVRMPRRYSGGLSAAIALLEEIGERFDLELCTDFIGEALTYSTRPVRAPFEGRAGR